MNEKYINYYILFLQCKNCVLMFINSRKCLSNFLQLEPCNDMFKVISDIMTHSYEMWNIITSINFCIAKKMDCALMIIISNHYVTKCLCYELQLEHVMLCSKWFLTCWHIDMNEKYFNYYILFLQCKENELCIDVYQSNHYGRKCVSNLLQLEPCNDMFKVISDIIAQSYDMWNIITSINFCIERKWIVHW